MVNVHTFCSQMKPSNRKHKHPRAKTQKPTVIIGGRVGLLNVDVLGDFRTDFDFFVKLQIGERGAN